MNVDNIVANACAVVTGKDTITTYSNLSTSGSNTRIITYYAVGEVFYQYRYTTGNYPTTSNSALNCIDVKTLEGSTPTLFFAEIYSVVFIVVALVFMFKFVVRPFWRTK